MVEALVVEVVMCDGNNNTFRGGNELLPQIEVVMNNCSINTNRGGKERLQQQYLHTGGKERCPQSHV